MSKKFAVTGVATFRFRHVVELTEGHLAGFQRDYSAAVAEEPSARAPLGHVIVASGGCMEKFLQLATTAGIRTELTSPDWDGLVGKGSIKVTYDGDHAV